MPWPRLRSTRRIENKARALVFLLSNVPARHRRKRTPGFQRPGEADFDDPLDVRTVSLDSACRQQQAAEGWFNSLEDVPKVAITLTMPALFRVPRLILSVPGPRKAEIVQRIIEEPISADCPATILRSHPNATLHLDSDSAVKLRFTEWMP